MMSMHKLMAGDGYTYLTRHVAAGDALTPARRATTSLKSGVGLWPSARVYYGAARSSDRAVSVSRPGTSPTGGTDAATRRVSPEWRAVTCHKEVQIGASRFISVWG